MSIAFGLAIETLLSNVVGASKPSAPIKNLEQVLIEGRKLTLSGVSQAVRD